MAEGVVRPVMFKQPSSIHPSLRASALGAAVPAAELDTLDRLGTLLAVAADESIVRSDAIGRECFVVVDGRFEVRRDDVVISVGPGEFVGELALLTRQPRTATVTAEVDSTVYVLNPAEFTALLDSCPAIARVALDAAVRRAAVPA